MPQRQVFFATNRVWDRAGGAFGFACEDPASRLWLGTIPVEHTADPVADGAVGHADVSGFDDFQGEAGQDGSAAAVLAAWLAAAGARDALPLLTVHGFNYTFAEACARAAHFCDAIEGASDLRLQPLAFTWPSNGVTSMDDYKRDRDDCTASGPALARLIRAIAAIPNHGRKPAYMAHSMGARATRCGMQALLRDGAALPGRVFGAAIVIAGDEDVDVLERPDGAMRPLLAIADWTTIGVYPEDTTLNLLSAKAQGQGPRLGAAGPHTPLDPADRAYTVDYAYAVSHDKFVPGGTTWNDIAHQYHRNDPRVLQDLAAALPGTSPADVPGRRRGHPDPNFGIRDRAGRLYVT